MSLNFREFTEAMTQWIGCETGAQAKEVLRPSMWRRLMLTGREVGGATVFDPEVITEELLEGRDDLYESVAVPVAEMLNSTFGPATGASAPAQAPVGGANENADDAVTEDAARPPSVPEPSYQAGEGEPAGSPGQPVDESAGESVGGPLEPTAAQPAVGAAAEPELDVAFPDYTYERMDLDAADQGGAHIPVSWQRVGGGLRYTWPDPGEGETYRVVVSDTAMPYSPDDFQEVAVTTGTTARDDSPATTAVRFVTVWGYEAGAEAGVLGQPRRVASGVVIHDLADWTVEFDAEARAVVGTWVPPKAPPGASLTVLTARLPQDEPPGPHLRSSSWMSFALPNNGQGFQDAQIVGGVPYTYVAAVEVVVEGQTYTSRPIPRRIVPEITVEAIEDLQAVQVPDADGTGLTLSLTWTQHPLAKTEIYRTREPVSAQASALEVIPLSQLATAGLPEEARLNTRLAAISDSDAPTHKRYQLDLVRWPEGDQWDALYLTPVTLHSDGQATIGKPIVCKRAGKIHNAVLTRRLTWDLVTFTWPGDAASVQIRFTAPGEAFDPAAAPLLDVSHDDYRAAGGCVLSEGMLPASGGTIHLNSLTYLSGQQITSLPVTVEVPSQWVYKYSLHWPGEGRIASGLLRRAAVAFGQTLVELQIAPVHGVRAQPDAVGVVLVHNTDHLPLNPADGTKVKFFLERPTKDGGQQAHSSVLIPPDGSIMSLWFDHATRQPGYFRLLVDSPAAASVRADEEASPRSLEHYALIDPELANLRKER
ncbi:hypothetical protein [Actinomyces sp. 565]|uniref:hypothetical protein n=1 Tax=Actinomyces sp. 565 TaxID=2057794 RepID=UPI0013A6EC27|nr:hypothetical protein [Actinomyces sp. 565]NDR53415.1 hypothetical protein [Actinomyces sp. 565]